MTNRDVACDAPHTGEYLTLAPGTAPDQPTCDAAAERYLGSIVSRFSDSLKVSAFNPSDLPDGQARCLLAVRGDNILTASVRDIRTKALPLQPGG